MDKPDHLERFVQAQASAYPAALAELRAGRKRTHWMWFVFPQVAGLGSSAMAQRYAIASLQEAKAYLAHPVLGERLRECAQAMLAVDGRSAHDILGSPDDLKFHSSMTLFHRAAPAEPVFGDCLRKYFAGEPDSQTVRLLAT
jgi:uncharacterized protein (DUF1810 family)